MPPQAPVASPVIVIGLEIRYVRDFQGFPSIGHANVDLRNLSEQVAIANAVFEKVGVRFEQGSQDFLDRKFDGAITSSLLNELVNTLTVRARTTAVHYVKSLAANEQAGGVAFLRSPICGVALVTSQGYMDTLAHELGEVLLSHTPWPREPQLSDFSRDDARNTVHVLSEMNLMCVDEETMPSGTRVSRHHARTARDVRRLGYCRLLDWQIAAMKASPLLIG